MHRITLQLRCQGAPGGIWAGGRCTINEFATLKEQKFIFFENF